MPMRTQVEKITPEIATAILEQSKDIKNRVVNQGHVEWLASQMKAGKWILNGECIILDDEDQLIDGQHRMWAVVESGATIETNVTRGADRKGFATIDTGSARTLGNVLGIVGERYAAALAAALSWTYRHDLGKMFSSSKAVGFSHQVGLTVLRKYPDIRDSAEFVSQVCAKNEILKRVSMSGLIFLHHRFATHARDKAKEFFETVGDIRFDKEGTPTRTLRNQILRREKDIGRDNLLETMAFFVKAWTDFLDGKSAKSSSYQWRRAGEYPEDFPRFPGEKESRGKAMKIVRRHKRKEAK